MAGEQGPNVSDPEARACLAAASAATSATDYLLCAVRDGERPNVEEIATCLADALDCLFKQYPGGDDETTALHLAAVRFLGLTHPDLDGED